MSDEGGFLIPPWYQGPQTPTVQDIALADIVLGFFLAVTSFCFFKALSHTITRWHRLKRFTAYLIMVWVDWGATIAHSFIGWCTGHDSCMLGPSFWLFFGIAGIWTIEQHCQAQILVNRVSLLLFDHARARRLKLAVFVIVFILTSSVIIIWTPARMEISQGWINANDVWDRVEKVLFLIFDVGINLYFVHRVRTTLIANGLHKYAKLYWFNVAIITLSILLDVAVIGTTWMPDYWIYIQFRPLTHMIKLYIEMHNAELIGRVAQASVDIRNMGQAWCDTENPAVESISLNASRLQLERRRQGKAPQTGDSTTRPSVPSRAGSGCKAMAMGKISANKAQYIDKSAPYQDSPAGSSSEPTSSENTSSSEHRPSNTSSGNTLSEQNISEQ